MDVGETRLRKVLSGDQRYLVPLYQRPYSWSERQLERLWSDLRDLTDELTRNPNATHFTGSLVLDLARVGPNGNEYLVVDGQQRLTTLSILLCAVRDHIEETEPDRPEKREVIHDRYLVDKYASGDDRLRLLPTQADLDDYRAIVDGSGPADGTSRVSVAYRFFRLQLAIADDPEDDQDIDRILEAALGALVFVSITARGDDNVYRIFESLNNTGMKLTQGDLLRNYVFMRLGQRGSEAYQTWWLPMQERLSSEDLEGLFWMDLITTNSEAKQGDVYAAQHERMDRLQADDVFEEVKRFAGLARLLEKMRHPERPSGFGASVDLHLSRLAAWGATAADPLVLSLLARTERTELSPEQLDACLGILESYIVRRLIVGASSGGLTRILLRAMTDMRHDMPVPEALALYFSTGRKFYASDDQIREAILTKPLYFMGKPQQKKLLLQWLEDTYGSKEPIDLRQATIEHVLPQTMTDSWRDALAHEADTDESAESIHETLVHTLGNLTLTAYNSELSNRNFAEKRALLAESGIRLNGEIARNETWGRSEILARGAELADRVIASWVAPVQVSDVMDSGVTWTLVRDAVEAIPAGNWSTYGDLAALAATYPQPVAAFVTRNPIQGAWRVMQAGGTISPGFRWGALSEYAARAPQEVLESEGLTFDGDGRADPMRRLTSQDLAQKLGLELDVERATDEAPADDGPGFDRFVSQLAEKHSASVVHGVLELLEAWRSMGGHLGFGSQAETSCFLMARRGRRDLSGEGIWPFTIYPKSGTVEVVFQYLKDRAPFDRLELRQELRQRLNRIEGIEIEADRLQLRPSFKVGVLESAIDRAEVSDVLRFFMGEVDALEYVR